MGIYIDMHFSQPRISSRRTSLAGMHISFERAYVYLIGVCISQGMDLGGVHLSVSPAFRVDPYQAEAHYRALWH
jgi:hypothetical protein